MPRPVPLGTQSFTDLRKNNCFYVDKTHFICEWWHSYDNVTLITRPRRFGKTLMLDTVRTFFSPEFKSQPELFTGLTIEQDETLMAVRGSVPVIFLSFANIKGSTFNETLQSIKFALKKLYTSFRFLLDQDGLLTERERKGFLEVTRDMPDTSTQTALLELSEFLERYYGVKPLILLDECDTPMQEAWLSGYWDEAVRFLRGFFNATFKTNPHLGRALLTGITRINKESLFSDLNNLMIATVTTDLYGDCFGFTEAEVFAAMDEYGLTDKDGVKAWYDGFIFGGKQDIYNPWSIIGYQSERRFDTYWVNTSSKALVGKLLQGASAKVKISMEGLLHDTPPLQTTLDEQVVFSELKTKPGAFWSLLIASGYLKVLSFDISQNHYTLALTNFESKAHDAVADSQMVQL